MDVRVGYYIKTIQLSLAPYVGTRQLLIFISSVSNRRCIFISKTFVLGTIWISSNRSAKPIFKMLVPLTRAFLAECSGRTVCNTPLRRCKQTEHCWNKAVVPYEGW